MQQEVPSDVAFMFALAYVSLVAIVVVPFFLVYEIWTARHRSLPKNGSSSGKKQYEAGGICPTPVSLPKDDGDKEERKE